MCVLSLIYSYAAVCMFCAVRCVIIIIIIIIIIICFSWLFSNFGLGIFFSIPLCLIYCFVCLFSIVCILRFCIVLALFLLLYIAVSFLFLYKSTDRCHRVQTQLQ